MFIQTEVTPNPNALKFFPGIDISAKPIHYDSVDKASNSKVARKLFEIEGVEAVFLGKDFITITKEENLDWNLVKPEVLMVIMDHFSAGFTTFDNPETTNTEIDTSNLSEIEKQIVEIIETRVRPSVAMDGGDIIYRSFEDGIVKLELRGSCSGCPSSTITLKEGIESMLQYYVPEVKSVEAVNS